MPHTQPLPRHSRLGPPENVHHIIRRKIFGMVRDIVLRDHLSVNHLKHIMRSSGSRAHAIIHGDIKQFNSETLIDLLARLGVSVDIVVTRTVRYPAWDIRNPRPGFRPFPTDRYIPHVLHHPDDYR